MSSSAGDTYTVQKSLQSSRDRTPYAKKYFLNQSDMNGGTYSNQVVFDLSSFANVQNGFINLSEATLQIPVVVSASVRSDATATTQPPCLDHMVGFKNGAHNIINSISCDYDGVPVIQPNNFSNAYVNYRIMSTWSTDDLKNFGPTCLFSPDSTNSWVYNQNDNATLETNNSRCLNGNGICNNTIAPKWNIAPFNSVSPYRGEDYEGNKGLLDRVKMIYHRPDIATPLNNTTTLGTTQNLAGLRNVDNYRTELKNYTKVQTTGQNFFQQWYILCNIRLKDLSSFFEAMPIVKGAYLKMNLVLNTGAVVVNVPVKAANSPAMYCNASDIYFQYTNPLIICERASAATAITTSTAAPAQLLFSVGIRDAPSTSVPNFISHSAQPGRQSHGLSACRVTLPIVELKAADQIAYLESSLNKRVEWTDIYQTQISNISPGSAFNVQLSNGTRGAVGVLLIPLVSGSVNGNLTVGPVGVASTNSLANTSFSPALSPFTTEPATSSPLSISQFQVMKNGENLLSPFISYSYEEWLFQANESIGKINGNQFTGLNNGLYSQADFENGLRYYYCALNRGNEEEDDKTMGAAITVSGTNNSQVAADYLVFIISKKSFNINCATGKVVA